MHAGIIEPGHFRFTVNGETVVRLEQRLGYAHKGIDALMAAPRSSAPRRWPAAFRATARSPTRWRSRKPPSRRSARRCRRARSGCGRSPAELERLANHLGDIGAVCNDASFSIMHASCGLLREQVLRTSHACFGHRLMMDVVVPGGMRCDLTADGAALVIALVAFLRNRFPELVDLYDNTASLKDRTVGTGVLSPALAQQFAAGGYVGRASGRHFDARRAPGYAPYDAAALRGAFGPGRRRERARVDSHPRGGAEPGAGRADPRAAARRRRSATRFPRPHGEGMALVEGFRGDIFAWVRLGADGRVERCHLRDPSWFQWPLLEAAIEGNIVADFPLCNKSFNCSYSGHDL